MASYRGPSEGDIFPWRRMTKNDTPYKGVKFICFENEKFKNYLVTTVADFRELCVCRDVAAAFLKEILCWMSAWCHHLT